MEEPILNSHNKLEHKASQERAHVQNTSEIGKFRIISHDFNEGIWRVRWKVTQKE